MPSCAVAWGWRRGSDGGPSPADPPVPPSVCGPAEVLGSVSSVLWKTIQHSSVLQRSVIENNIFFFFFFPLEQPVTSYFLLFFSKHVRRNPFVWGFFYTSCTRALFFRNEA